MKRFFLFFILLALPLSFVACPQADDDENVITIDDDDDDVIPDDDDDDDNIDDDDDDSDDDDDDDVPAGCEPYQEVNGYVHIDYQIPGVIRVVLDSELGGNNTVVSAQDVVPDESGTAYFSFGDIPYGEFYIYAILFAGNHGGAPTFGDATGRYPDRITVCKDSSNIYEFSLEPNCRDQLDISGKIDGAGAVNPITPVRISISRLTDGGGHEVVNYTIDPNIDGQVDYASDLLEWGFYSIAATQYVNGVVGAPPIAGDRVGQYSAKPVFLCGDSILANFSLAIME